MESGPLPARFKDSVCVEFAPFSPHFSLILSLREDIKSTECLSARGSSFNTTPSSHFYFRSLVTVPPDLFVPPMSAACCRCICVNKSTMEQTSKIRRAAV